MAKLEKEPDTIISPQDALTEGMKLEGTDNDLDHNQFLGDDEVDSLNVVPGYEAAEESSTNDELEDEMEDQSSTNLSPNNPS